MPTIHLTAHLRRVAPTGPTRVEAATLGAALDAYFETAPRVRSYILDDQGRLRKHVAVFIDGELLTDKRTSAAASRRIPRSTSCKHCQEAERE